MNHGTCVATLSSEKTYALTKMYNFWPTSRTLLRVDCCYQLSRSEMPSESNHNRIVTHTMLHS